MTVTESLTASQQARRERMLAAALDLAAAGGFDAVQMREVAERAEVALGTLYRYFPSKERLLVSAMAQSVDDLRTVLGRKPPQGSTPTARVVDVLRRANRFLTRSPDMTAAMIKAMTSGDDISDVVVEVTDVMTGIIGDAISPQAAPTAEHLEIATILNYVWLSALVSWVSGVNDAPCIDEDLVAAATRLLNGSPAGGRS